MADEVDEKLESEPSDAVEEVKEAETEESVEAEALEESPIADLTEKRGRMVTTGLMAAIILSVLAVAVVGIFQLTVRWMTACPVDLTVNDPAKALWAEIVSEKSTSRSLGIPETLKAETEFKGFAPEAK